MAVEEGDRTRMLVVWVPDWPVMAVDGGFDQPTAVLSANRVVCASPAARAQGVARGIRKREAQRACPEVRIVERDPAAEAREFESVVAALDAITPRLELSRPGRVAFPTRGPSRYFGGDVALAERVVDLVDEMLAGRTAGTTGATSTAGTAGAADAAPAGWCRVGVADGEFAARCAARAGLRTSAPVVIPEGETPSFLSPLPVAALDTPDLVDVLLRLGLRTLGAVARLDPRDVIGRFGAEGMVAWRRACGLEDRPPDLVDPPRGLRAEQTLDPPAERIETAAFVARTLGEELSARLAEQGLACTRLLVMAEMEDGERSERVWRDDGPLSANAIAQRVRWQLEGWLHRARRPEATGGITGLALVPVEVTTAGGHQPGFWGGSSDADERAQRGLARIQGLLGVEGVKVPEPVGGRAPGERIRLVPFDTVERRGATHPSLAAPWPGRLPSPAPAVVHPRPQEARVEGPGGVEVQVTGRGEITGAPERVSIGEGPWLRVHDWAGPWPCDERWWDPTGHRRRARIQVVLTGGSALLLVAEDRRWWCEATYD